MHTKHSCLLPIIQVKQVCSNMEKVTGLVQSCHLASEKGQGTAVYGCTQQYNTDKAVHLQGMPWVIWQLFHVKLSWHNKSSWSVGAWHGWSHFPFCGQWETGMDHTYYCWQHELLWYCG